MSDASVDTDKNKKWSQLKDAIKEVQKRVSVFFLLGKKQDSRRLLQK